MSKDEYMRVFLRNICLNKSCADCHYGKLPRIADITLGDYWNIASVHPEMDDNKGTSVVLLNTVQGESLFMSILGRVNVCDSTLDKAVAGNPCIVRSSIEHPKRTAFFADLDKKSLNQLIVRFCPYPTMRYRICKKIKDFLKKIDYSGVL